LALLSPFRNTIYILYNGTPTPNADEHLAKKITTTKTLSLEEIFLNSSIFGPFLVFSHFTEQENSKT
jgi:hypothetical protein